MSKHDTGTLRNLALIGGPATGKTSLSESILEAAGALPRAGSVKDGTTLSDVDAEEQDKQHSILLGVLNADPKGYHLNLFDCPGYPDFVGEAAAAMGAVETAALCVRAGEGLTFPGHRAWTVASREGRARAVIVTGVDLDEFDWDELLSTFEEGLGVRCLPVMRPKGSGSSFSGVDIVNFSDELDGELAAMRDALIEAAVEVDEEAMTAYLEDDAPPSPEQTAKLLTRSMVEGSLVPVLCCSAVDGRGVPEVLKFITTYFPSPLDGPFFKDADENEIKPTEDGTVVYVFKTIIDPFVGQLCLLRIMRGEVSDAQHLQLSRTGKDEKISHLETIQGKQHQPSGSAVAGDIVAVAKMDHLVTEDTLCDPAHPIEVKPVRVPRAMVARAITLKDHADEVKLSTALKRAAAEDLTFAYDRSESTGQLVAHGVSLMHLEGVLKRMKDRYKVAVNLAVPRVAFQESSQIPAKGHHRHKKQTGGRGQFGEVYLSIEPGERGTGLDFRNATVGGSIPRNFIPAVEKGVIEVMQHGVIAGYPVKDVVVSVTDGKHHDVDSDEASFKLAGARAFKEAFIKSKPVLLEPVLEMQIAVPSRFMGAITSDITGRRGQITGMDALGDTQIVKANVPQKEVLTYSTALRSMTQGEGSYTAEFHDYEVMPPNVQQEVMAEFTPKGDED